MTISLIAFLFPGQGSQTVGMGGALAASHAAAKQVFEEINDALGENLFAIMQNGPDDAIRMTRNAQPALFATSMAAVRVLEAELGAPLTSRGGMTAGHSLGEYAALAASGSLSISDAARLLRQRGDSMQSAVPVGEGAMAAVLGGDEDQINAILTDAKSSGLVQIANDNAPGQIVISGDAGAVDAAIEIAKAAGLRRAIKLPVSAPFHCDLMAPAADVMAKILADTKLLDALMPVYCNVSAAAETRSDHLRANLVTQVTARVRWRESLIAMSDAGARKFIELGTGKVLSSLVKRGVESDAVVNLDRPDDLDSVLAEM
ncbi:ACP S-malonyltransferase [Alphaproteobacteria bacterium]|nr:ACP S-malonyltransferase [Alphaproteobacteria bacterium]